jgi:hypothetical protein
MFGLGTLAEAGAPAGGAAPRVETVTFARARPPVQL